MACDKSPSSYSNLYLDRMALAKKNGEKQACKVVVDVYDCSCILLREARGCDDYNCMNALERDTGA